MSRRFFARAWFLVPVLATLGLLGGVAVANALNGRGEQFSAEATLAMLPPREVPVLDVSSFWEVLNRGQATGSAALVIGDDSWLDAAASSAGVPRSELTLSAGAIPETTLITVTMKAGSAWAAEEALGSVLTAAVGPAEAVSAPFRIEVVASPDGSAQAMGPARVQILGALGLAGLVVGAGAGLLLSRFLRGRQAHRSKPADDDEHDRVPTANDHPLTDEILVK